LSAELAQLGGRLADDHRRRPGAVPTVRPWPARPTTGAPPRPVIMRSYSGGTGDQVLDEPEASPDFARVSPRRGTRIAGVHLEATVSPGMSARIFVGSTLLQAQPQMPLNVTSRTGPSSSRQGAAEPNPA